MAPPKSAKYLYPINDFENFEFRSQIDPWNPQQRFKADFDKIKCLEIILTPGKFLFIPAYWWYTFKFNENTSVSCFRYRTYMNNVAICPSIAMYALQNQNVDRKIVKKIDIKNTNVNNINVTETTNISDINVTESFDNNTTNISDISDTNIAETTVSELDVNSGTNIADLSAI
jgi:hypothetical protein